MSRFIAAVTTRDNRIAELVFREAFPTATLEGILRTPAEIPWRLALQLILTVRTLSLAIADSRPRNASATLLALEGLFRALGTIEFGIVERAFLIGTIAAVWPAVTHKEPADADATRATLEGTLCTARVVRGTGLILRMLCTIASAVIAKTTRICQLALLVHDTLQPQRDWTIT